MLLFLIIFMKIKRKKFMILSKEYMITIDQNTDMGNTTGADNLYRLNI